MASIYTRLNRKKKSRVNNDRKEGIVTPKSDLSSYNYTRTWDQELIQNVYGYDVPVPDKPKDKDIINYGRPLAEQIFRKTAIPKDFNKWTVDQQEVFIEREHHRRKHGLWFYIKGEPTYIPGLFYYFMNYWPLATGQPTKFHFGDWKFFMIWQLVVMDPLIFGLVVFKCRRIGDTEKALCMVYEYATRVRNTINQLYDCRVEDDMKKTWKRLKIAHKRMVWFMKPVCSNDDPANMYEFRAPKKKMDESNSYIDDSGQIVLDEYEFKELDSDISYFTNSGGADGARVGRAYIDEFGKFKQIHPEEIWGLMKKALEDDREGEIIGKALFTSTIEEMKGGATLDVAKKMWKDSNPENVGPDGRTMSGLIRIVRGAVDRDPADRWGKVDEEAVIARIQARHQFLIDNKQWTTLIKEKRQDCLTIKDVFSNISKGSPFNMEKISNRKNEIEHDTNPRWVRGNFEWVDGKKPVLGNPDNINKKCKVYFKPCDNGRWEVAWHPKDFNISTNGMEFVSRAPAPGNTYQFSSGIDPIAYRENMTNATDGDNSSDDGIVLNTNRSLSGLTIKRNLDLSIDSDPELWDIEGNPVDGGRGFKTNRYCCAYLYRHDTPSDNYEDWLKTLIYYGSDFLIEKNHSTGFAQYLENMGYMGYYREGGSGISNYKGQQETSGLTATEKTVDAYFGAISELIERWWNTIDLPVIMEQLSTMEYETRGKHDVGVAVGFTELLSTAKQMDIAIANEMEMAGSQEYFYENEYD